MSNSCLTNKHTAMKIKWVQTHSRDSRMQFHSTTPIPQEVAKISIFVTTMDNPLADAKARLLKTHFGPTIQLKE